MRIRFWGTRGSIPTPGRTTVRYGGNTPCVELVTEAGTRLIFDSGTGIRELGIALANDLSPGQRLDAHLFLSHTHWDHIQGFPFFNPIYMPQTHLRVYAGAEVAQTVRDTMGGQMIYPYFPVEFGSLGARIDYHGLTEGSFEIDDVRITVQYLNHTLLCLGYRVEADGRTFCYCTDIEPNARRLLHEGASIPRGGQVDFADLSKRIVHDEDRRYAHFVREADLLVHDAMYTELEYGARLGWGHSTVEFATELSMLCNVGRLALYHHEPVHDDAKLESMLETCLTTVAQHENRLQVFLAQEGLEVEV